MGVLLTTKKAPREWRGFLRQLGAELFAGGHGVHGGWASPKFGYLPSILYFFTSFGWVRMVTHFFVVMSSMTKTSSASAGPVNAKIKVAASDISSWGAPLRVLLTRRSKHRTSAPGQSRSVTSN